MTRIVKYNYGLWDKAKQSGFVNIYDENFYICTRWREGKLVEVPELPEDSYDYFLVWYEKLTNQGCKPEWSMKLIADFWVEGGEYLLLEDLGVEVDEDGDRIRQIGGEWLSFHGKYPVENFDNFNLLGI